MCEGKCIDCTSSCWKLLPDSSIKIFFHACARNRLPLSGLHSKSQTTFELLPPPLVHVAQNEQQTQNFNSCCNIVSVYTCTVPSSPGPTQIFLHGCEIKSGWGLGTKLHVHVPLHGVCVLVTCFNTCYGWYLIFGLAFCYTVHQLKLFLVKSS